MQKATLLVCGALMLAIASTATAPTANAEPDMTGRWVSDSLRDNRVGYFFELARSAQGYTGDMRFTHRDGRRLPAMPMTVSTNGNSVVLRASAGRFDRSVGPLRGVLSQGGTVLTLTNCRARLRLVMAADLDSDCVFRRTPSATS